MLMPVGNNICSRYLDDKFTLTCIQGMGWLPDPILDKSREHINKLCDVKTSQSMRAFPLKILYKTVSVEKLKKVKSGLSGFS